MKYYVFDEPYFSLVLAENAELALEYYKEEVCSNIDGDYEFDDYVFNEVEEDEAIMLVAEEVRSNIEDYPEMIKTSEEVALDTLKKSSGTLLIDESLI